MPIAALRPPDGWRLDQTPTATRQGSISRDPEVEFNRQNVAERYNALRDWATREGLQLAPSDYSLINYEQYLDIYCWTTFSITRAAAPDNAAVIAPFPCTGCGNEIAIGQVYCEPCDRFIVCDTCHLAGLRLYGVRGQEGSGACPSCSVECASDRCTNRMPRSEGFDRCADCDPRAGCHNCARMVPLAQLVQHTHNGNPYYVCPNCTAFVCAECDGCFPNTADRNIGGNAYHICDACAQVHFDRERQAFERWNADELPISGSLLIPSTASRPIRTVSIETEFDGDGVAVGKALAGQGLLPAPERIPRHREEGQQRDRHPCLLKSDGSVTGGELVAYLLDLDHENHAAALMRMTEVMRGCRELGQAQFTHRAGGHIHIDLHGLTAKDLWAQYTIFNYLQAPIFYFAGAGAEYGHRELAGSGYTPPGPSGPFGTVGKFAQAVLNNNGRYALHYSNFVGAKNRCECGSYLTGAWEDCTCNLGKATAEWRVWNAEITPRILHGWLAFMQALTAYATDVEGFKESDYPPLLWSKKHFAGLTTGEKNQIKERLEWIHRELPLTLHERDSIIYGFKRSELIGLGENYLDGLLDIQPENEFGVKKPARNPNTRKATEFALAAVEGAGADVRHVDEFFVDDEDDDYDDGGW